MLLTSPTVSAAAGDGSLTVNVIRDVNYNGTIEPILEPGISNVTVRFTDNNGASFETQTDSNGAVLIPAGDPRLTGGKYRVEVLAPANKALVPAVAKPKASTAVGNKELSTTVSFVVVSLLDIEHID